MKTAKQFSRQRTRHTFLLKAPADAQCNAPCRLRGHDQPLSAHATLSVPALLAEHPLRVSRLAASVASIPHGIDLLLHMIPAAFFLPPKRTPKASSIRADGPAQNRVAGGHFNARKPCFALVLGLLLLTRATPLRNILFALGSARICIYLWLEYGCERFLPSRYSF